MGVLEADCITVGFPGTKALDGVNIRLETGAIHVLAGQNGAGKTTLIKVLSGVISPDAGRIKLDGRVIKLNSPSAAHALGIRLVPQELQLFPRLTVWENILPATSSSRLKLINRSKLRTNAKAALELLGAEFALDTLIDDLSPGQRQIILIAQSLATNAQFLILDEPTAALSQAERNHLLKLLPIVAEQKTVGILFVSHHLHESLAIGQEVSVLRDGKLVWTRHRSEVTLEQFERAIFGELSTPALRELKTTHQSAIGSLAIEDLQWAHRTRPLTFEINSGTILGVAGLPGSGAETMNSAIAGALTQRRGRVILNSHTLPRSVRGTVASGVAFIPGERKTSGLFPLMSVTNNICAANLSRFTRIGLLSTSRMQAHAHYVVRALSVVPQDITVPVSSLSGGNQQKVIVGRYIDDEIKLLLADEPTRGVDQMARSQIHLAIKSLAQAGKISIIYSSDLLELTQLATRFLILGRDGSAEIYDGTLDPEELFKKISDEATSIHAKT